MPILYSLPPSPPCRAVLMLADILDIKDLEVKDVDIFKEEHLTPEFLKINPHHSIPTLVDDDLTLNESRSILGYLVDKYAPNSTLYPQDIKKRAKIDQVLYFDGSSFCPAIAFLVVPTIKLNLPYNPEFTKLMDDRLKLLNEDLASTPFLAGDTLTIGDISVLASFTMIEAIGLVKTDHLTHIHNWVKRIKDSGKIKNYDDLVVNTAKFCGQIIRDIMKLN